MLISAEDRLARARTVLDRRPKTALARCSTDAKIQAFRPVFFFFFRMTIRKVAGPITVVPTSSGDGIEVQGVIVHPRLGL